MTADGKRRRSGSSCPDSRKASTAASRQYEATRPHLTAGVQSILGGVSAICKSADVLALSRGLG